MTFIHEDAEFGALVRIVAGQRQLSPGIIEKDYWITHSLWALQQTGLDVFFKGGTSLSKGFGLIERFSEDLDLKLEPGTRTDLPTFSSPRSEKPKPTAERRAYLEALPKVIRVPGASPLVMEEPAVGDKWRSARFRAEYPATSKHTLPAGLKPWVLFEVGIDHWTPPLVRRDLTALVHEHLLKQGMLAQYTDNRPSQVQCVHPWVTLVEKLDAIARRYPREPYEPETFVRHYEDAAHLINALDDLPPLPLGTREGITRSVLRTKRIDPDDEAFVLPDPVRREGLERAHKNIQAIYWGPRISLAECCRLIRPAVRNTPALTRETTAEPRAGERK